MDAGVIQEQHDTDVLKKNELLEQAESKETGEEEQTEEELQTSGISPEGRSVSVVAEDTTGQPTQRTDFSANTDDIAEREKAGAFRRDEASVLQSLRQNTEEQLLAQGWVREFQKFIHSNSEYQLTMIQKQGQAVRRISKSATKADKDTVDKIRTTYHAEDRNNCAFCTGNINGQKIDLQVVSGMGRNKGNFQPPDFRKYHYKVDDVTYQFHTEQKIVEYLRAQIQKRRIRDPQGKISIVSEREFCHNCSDVVDRFQKEYPGITIIRVGTSYDGRAREKQNEMARQSTGGTR